MEELVEKAKNGDKEAFTKVFLKYEEDLFKLAILKVNNEEDAKDIAQETMIDAYFSIKTLKNNKAFKKWIVKILLNKCKNYYRKKGDKLIHLDNCFLQNLKNLDNDYIEVINSKIDFSTLIHELNQIEREIVILRYNEKYSIKEISKIININENTVKSKLKRIREKIKIKKKEEVKSG